MARRAAHSPPAIDASKIAQEDVLWCGQLHQYDKAFDRITPKLEKPLQRFFLGIGARNTRRFHAVDLVRELLARRRLIGPTRQGDDLQARADARDLAELDRHHLVVDAGILGRRDALELAPQHVGIDERLRCQSHKVARQHSFDVRGGHVR